MAKYLLVGLLLILMAAGGVWIFNRNQSGEPILQSAVESATEAVQEEQKIPFYELTIPALREKTLKSELEEKQLLLENGSYASFLTSFKSDGLKINGLLTQPTGAMPEGGWPGIVFVHGYVAPTVYRTTEKYEAYVDYLARNGFVVFKIDLRGHGDSEGEPGGAYYSSDYIVDTLNAYSALQASGLVNPSKIGLWGHSMAGNVITRAMAVKPEIPAVVIWAGAVYTYTDLARYGISDNSYRPPSTQGVQEERIRKRQQMFEIHGQPNQDSKFWQTMAVTSYLKELAGAIALHHAVDDEVVNIGYSRDMDTLLDSTTVPHEFYEYSSGGHNINGSSFNLAMQRTVDFFKRNLK